MGVFSEMSIEQERGDSPTSANIVPSAPAEPETPAWDEPAVTAPPAFNESACPRSEQYHTAQADALPRPALF